MSATGAVRVVEFPVKRVKRNVLGFARPITKRVPQPMDDLPVEHFVRERGRLKCLVVSLLPNGVLTLRVERSRRKEQVLLSHCYALAVRQRVAAERAAGKKGHR